MANRTPANGLLFEIRRRCTAWLEEENPRTEVPYVWVVGGLCVLFLLLGTMLGGEALWALGHGFRWSGSYPVTNRAGQVAQTPIAGSLLAGGALSLLSMSGLAASLYCWKRRSDFW